MAKPTLRNCFDQARALLADDVTPGGEVFTDNMLMPHGQQAYRELWRVLRGAQDPFVLQEAYFIVPINTSVVDPATMGLANMPEPEFVEWRLAGSSVAISGAVPGTDSNGSPIVTITTGTPHGLTSGTSARVWGVQGFDQFQNPNSIWTITVTSSTTFTLNGCTATGTYVANTGFVTGGAGTGQFIPMTPVDWEDYLPDSPGVAGITQASYAWEGGVFHIPAASQAREIRVLYRSSGATLITPQAIIPIDDCQDFLATRIAAIAAKTRASGPRPTELNIEALGPNQQADGSGGLLGQLLRVDIRNLQRKVYRRPGFRPRRNRPDLLIW